jgi:hypothetical protein
MRNAYLAILIGCTALVPAMAPAQTPQSPPSSGTNPGATATLADCDRLLAFLEQRHPENAGVTSEQVRAFKTGNNAKACHDVLVRIDPTGTQTGQATKEGDKTNIVVQQPAPAVRVEQAPPQVTVQQQQPQVTVRQPQPEIIVRQPAPTVTVDIPQPEIVVKMPPPDVNVAMAQPQVQVNQPPPQVQVTQPQQPQVQVQPAEPRVNVQQEGATAKVQVEENNSPPNVRYERAEPKVVVNPPQGEPQVRFEQAERNPAPPSGSPQATTTGVGPNQGLTVARIKKMDLYNDRGERLGDVERVVQSPDGKRHVVVGVGGFLGIGETHVAIPAERLAFRGNRLVAVGLTNDEIKKLPAFDRNNRGFQEVDANATLEIASR